MTIKANCFFGTRSIPACETYHIVQTSVKCRHCRPDTPIRDDTRCAVPPLPLNGERQKFQHIVIVSHLSLKNIKPSCHITATRAHLVLRVHNLGSLTCLTPRPHQTGSEMNITCLELRPLTILFLFG